MQLRTLSLVAHPTLVFILVLNITLGLVLLPSLVGFVYAAPGGQKVFYYLHDHLGGISAVTDEQGNVVCSNDYLPFGEARMTDCTEEEDYGFTGKEKDPETDLYYYGARYYDPMLGRFVSPDPLSNALDTLSPQELQVFLSNPQNLNPYSYVKNNPLRYTDPTGQYERDVHYDLTFFLGYQAGLSFDQAETVAYRNQYMDENSLTKPVDWANFVTGNTEYHHFASKDEANRRVNMAIFKKNLEQFGDALHTFQDTFSHEGFKNKHLSKWTAPDKTYNNVAKADRMARASFFRLRKLNLEINGPGDLTRDEYGKESARLWRNMQKEVHEYNKLEDKSNTRIGVDAEGARNVKNR